MIGWGLVGLGAAGKQHLKVLSAIPGINMVVICDLRQDRLNEQGNLYGIDKRYTDYRDMFLQPGVAAVSVATSDDFHYPVVMEAARRRKHVCCEKPLSPTAKEAGQMVEEMEKAGCLLSVSFNYRQDRVMLKIKAFLNSGIIGQARVIRLVHLGSAPDLAVIRRGCPEDIAQLRINHMMKAGGPIFDCGVHHFDIALVLAGSSYKKIEAKGCNIRGFTYPDHTVAVCEHENGIMSIIENSFAYAFGAKEHKEYVRRDIIGDKGTITYNLETQILEVYYSEGTIGEEIPYPSHNETRSRIYKEFAASIEEGKLRPTIASGKDGLKATEAALMALTSQTRNLPISRKQ